jgi:hypothetical protein
MTDTDDQLVGGEVSGKAARLLELAARNAEELLKEAHAEAARVRSQARTDAVAVLAAARYEAERFRLTVDEARRRIDADLARLKNAAGDHRTLLRLQLHAVLAQVEMAELVWASGEVDGDAAAAFGGVQPRLGALGPQPVDDALDEVPVQAADQGGVPRGQGVERAVAELDAGPAALA